MRIGIVSEYVRPWPGGISEHVHHEAEELRGRGHFVQVISGGPADGKHDVLRLGRALTFTSNGARSRLALGSFAFRMREVLSRLALDVLHVHAPLDPCLPLMAAAHAPCPVVGTFHASFEPSPFWQALYGQRNPLAQRALRALHARIVVSEEARRSIQHYCPGAFSIVPNGVDLARFTPPPPREPNKRLRILFVGRDDPRKGLPLLLRAHAALVAQGVPVELVLCGVTRAQLGRAARADVHTFGYVPPHELPEHYREADVFCSPAVSGESQGVVLLEAMASARACVCFDIPGYRELIEDGVQGLLVRERSASALARALERTLKDAALRARLGAAGRERATLHAWPDVAERLEATLLAAHARPIAC